jgi:hypothetical protein
LKISVLTSALQADALFVIDVYIHHQKCPKLQ